MESYNSEAKLFPDFDNLDNLLRRSSTKEVSSIE